MFLLAFTKHFVFSVCAVSSFPRSFSEVLSLAAAYLMLRSPKEDTVLSVPRRDNPKVFDQIPLKKDTEVALDFVGCSTYLLTYEEPLEILTSFVYTQTMIQKFFRTQRGSFQVAGPNPPTALRSNSSTQPAKLLSLHPRPSHPLSTASWASRLARGLVSDTSLPKLRLCASWPMCCENGGLKSSWPKARRWTGGKRGC